MSNQYAGHIRSPSVEALRALNYLKTKSGDPAGMLRHNGKGRTEDLFQDIPCLPAVSLYGYHFEWTFDNDHDVDTTNVWTEVKDVAGESLTVQDERGGVARLKTGANNNDHYYYIGNYEIAQIASAKDMWFRTRIKIADVDQADWFVGLCAKVSAADALFDARQNAIGFYGVDGVANIYLETRLAGTRAYGDSTQDIADNTFMPLAFHCVSTTTVEFFVNNSYVATYSTYIPTTEMAVAFGLRNGQAQANYFSIGRTMLTMDE